MRGITAFREAYLASDPAHVEGFESLTARQMRYAIFWAFYENTAYSKVHNWSTTFKHQLALGKYIRALYNPAFRIGGFYAAHLWGGELDTDAGLDGCIPIETENDDIRPAIATLWRDSNFSALKDVCTLRGTVEGDVILRVADDVEKQRVYLERIDAGTVTEITKDAYGNAKGYVIEEQRADPQSPPRAVTYRLEVSREDEYVVFRTFKNNAPYGWNGQPAEWVAPYGFVPLVHIQHHDVGLDWGWSELHPMRTKVAEVDDLASMLSDHVRKYVHPTLLMIGMDGPAALTQTGGTAVETGAADTRPQPGREETPFFWAKDKDADVKPMVADLDIADALTHLQGLLKEIERDYPELRVDQHATSGTSGRALRIARQEVEAKVRQRRGGYDAGLVRLQQMALSIGGMRSYPGYEGLSEASFAAGELDHTIAGRSVFEPDPMDDIEISMAFWSAAKMAKESGASVPGYLRSQGLSDEQIAELEISEQEGGGDAEQD